MDFCICAKVPECVFAARHFVPIIEISRNHAKYSMRGWGDVREGARE